MDFFFHNIYFTKYINSKKVRFLELALASKLVETGLMVNKNFFKYLVKHDSCEHKYVYGSI